MRCTLPRRLTLGQNAVALYHLGCSPRQFNHHITLLFICTRVLNVVIVSRFQRHLPSPLTTTSYNENNNKQ